MSRPGTGSALLVALTTLAAGALILAFPLGRDAGVFAYDATELLAGRTPYLDFVDQKPPAIVFLYAVPVGLFGRSMAGIHFFELIWTAATALLACLIARRLSGAAAGVLAGLGAAFLFSPAVCDFWHRAQVETFLSLLYAAGVLLLFATGRFATPARFFGAGLLAGACACLKPNAVAAPVLVAAVAWAFPEGGVDGGGERKKWPTAVAFSTGLLVFPILLCGWLYGRGAFRPFLEYIGLINTPYLEASLAETLRLFFTQDGQAIALAGGVALVLLLARLLVPRNGAEAMRSSLGPAGTRLRHAALLAALWVGGLATLISGRFLFPYHHQVLILPAALSIGVAGAALLAPLRGMLDRRRWLAATSALLAALLVLVAVERSLKPPDRAFLRGDLSLADYRVSTRFDFWDFSFRDDRALADEFIATTGSGDRIQIFGHATLVLFLAGRRSATRFTFTEPAMDPRYGQGGRDREEILASLRADPPPLVVITRHDPLHNFDVTTSDRQVAAFPPLVSFLDETYEPGHEIGDYLVRPRKAPEVPEGLAQRPE